MPGATIDRLIVNSPCEEPAQHWRYDRKTRLFDLAAGDGRLATSWRPRIPGCSTIRVLTRKVPSVKISGICCPGA